jgi:hypothetical protein
MPRDRHDGLVRLTRVNLMMAVARLRKSRIMPSERERARLLFAQLDDMLDELLHGGDPAVGSSIDGRVRRSRPS